MNNNVFKQNGDNMKLGRLFVGKRVCNESNRFILASWSYVTGYWRWSIDYRKYENIKATFKWPIIRPSYNSGEMYSPSKGRFGAYIVIPFFGCISIDTQPPLPSMKKWKL